MVIIKTESQIEKIHASNKLVAEFLNIVKEKTKPGITTMYLNKLAEEFAYANNAIPGFLNYKGFPYSICASVNSEIVHGFPSDKPLEDGDILTVDYGIYKDGYNGDAAVTIPVGKISKKTKHLLKTTEECLHLGIGQAMSGNRVGDIGYAIQSHAEKNGYFVVKEYIGHGIGKNLHEPPSILNYGEKSKGFLLKSGMCICIEPMLMCSDTNTKVQRNGWTVATGNSCLSCHFEHCIRINDGKAEILSINKKGGIK